jgi:transcriptional regulator with XRE-family HTH domain
MAPVKKPPHKRARHYLREWREFCELTQDQAADRANLDRSSLSKIERGEVPYNQDLLERLALAYGCDPSDLLDINPLKPDPPRLVYNRLREVSPVIQERALAVLDALLKASSILLFPIF